MILGLLLLLGSEAVDAEAEELVTVDDVLGAATLATLWLRELAIDHERVATTLGVVHTTGELVIKLVMAVKKFDVVMGLKLKFTSNPLCRSQPWILRSVKLFLIMLIGPCLRSSCQWDMLLLLLLLLLYLLFWPLG